MLGFSYHPLHFKRNVPKFVIIRGSLVNSALALPIISETKRRASVLSDEREVVVLEEGELAI